MSDSSDEGAQRESATAPESGSAGFEQAGSDGSSGPDGAPAQTAEALPYGWYYFGPDPFQAGGPAATQWGAWQGETWQGGGAGQARHPQAHHPEAHHPEAQYPGSAPAEEPAHHAMKEAFDRLSRGDLSAESLGKLLDLDDREFWKGALVGAAATLIATNLPALKGLLEGLARPAAGRGKARPETEEPAEREEPED